MKKTPFITALVMIITTTAFSQTGIKLKNGQQVTQTTSSWVNTLIADKKFLKANDEGRAKIVEKHNEKINDGKVKGFGGTPFVLTMVDFKAEGDKQSIAFQMGPYKFPMVCKNDTLLLFRMVASNLVLGLRR